MEDLLSIAKITAKNIRDILNKRSEKQLAETYNKNKDIKLSADIIAHNFIVDGLGQTGIPIFSEENRNKENFDLKEYQWIIDPLDGTLNYSRGFNISAVSISLWNNNCPIIGVIAPVFSNDIFFAEKGKGAWKNDRKISVSKVENKKNAVLATGFSAERNYIEDSLIKTIQNISDYKKIRMIGSAATMLTMVASGVFDAYEEEDIFIWDIAAGLLLVKEAGGNYFMENGSSNLQYNIKASNKYLFNVL